MGFPLFVIGRSCRHSRRGFLLRQARPEPAASATEDAAALAAAFFCCVIDTALFVALQVSDAAFFLALAKVDALHFAD